MQRNETILTRNSDPRFSESSKRKRRTSPSILKNTCSEGYASLPGTHANIPVCLQGWKASIDKTGLALTDDALAAARDADAIILGAIGGPVRTQVPIQLAVHLSTRIQPFHDRVNDL